MAAQGDVRIVASALIHAISILEFDCYDLGSLSFSSKAVFAKLIFQGGRQMNLLGPMSYLDSIVLAIFSLWFWMTPGRNDSRVVSAGREMFAKISARELALVASLAELPNNPLQQLCDAGILGVSEDNGVVRVEHIRDDEPWWEKPLPSFLLKSAAAAALTFPLAVLCVIIASLLKSFFLDKPLDTTTFTVLFIFLFFYIDWKMISSKSVESLQLGKQEAQRWVIRAANIPVIPAAMVNAGTDGGAGQVEF